MQAYQGQWQRLGMTCWFPHARSSPLPSFWRCTYLPRACTQAFSCPLGPTTQCTCRRMTSCCPSPIRVLNVCDYQSSTHTCRHLSACNSNYDAPCIGLCLTQQSLAVHQSVHSQFLCVLSAARGGCKRFSDNPLLRSSKRHHQFWSCGAQHVRKYCARCVMSSQMPRGILVSPTKRQETYCEAKGRRHQQMTQSNRRPTQTPQKDDTDKKSFIFKSFFRLIWKITILPHRTYFLLGLSPSTLNKTYSAPFCFSTFFFSGKNRKNNKGRWAE